MEPVVIYGAGGLGEEVQDTLGQGGRYEPVAYLDSSPQKQGTVVGGLPVEGGLSFIDELQRRGLFNIIVAVGDNVARVALAETLASHGMRLISAIHPLASISRSAQIAEHVIIGPRVSICVNTTIGPHTVLSAGALCDHDNVIGKGVFLGPAVRMAGGVQVGDFAWLGIGTSVIPGRRIGRAARIQPGAVVIHDVPHSTLAAGVPAEPTSGGVTRFVPEQAIA